MKVLVDSSIWSLAFRRDESDLNTEERAALIELRKLVNTGEAVLLGVVRQEVLSGIRSEETYRRLRDDLRSFPDPELTTEDYESAAEAFNICRRKGVSGSVVDLLICAAAIARRWSIFSTDGDFRIYKRTLPIVLHAFRSSPHPGRVS